MCNRTVYSCNTTWSHFHSCNTLVEVIQKYKSQNVSFRKVAVFVALLKILLLFRNGDIRVMGGEAEGKDA